MEDPAIKPFSKAACLALVGLLASCAPSPPEVAGPENKPEPTKSKPVETGKTAPPKVGKGKSGRMGLDDFYPLQQSGKVLVYDVRVPYFYNIDHIPGALNWPSPKYEEEILERDIEIRKARSAGIPVVLYCFNLGCPEARNVARKLSRRGHEVAVLTMGIDSWRNAGLPMETPDSPADP